MTIGSLLVGTFISEVLFVLTKVVFIKYLNLDSWLIKAAFFIVLAIAAIATVRRMGILNYIESFFLVIVWTIAGLITDYIITTRILGLDVYTTLNFWLAYIVIIVAVLVFHKKMHIEARKSKVK